MQLTEVVAVTEGFDPVEEITTTTSWPRSRRVVIEHTKDGQQIDVEIRWRRVASDGEVSVGRRRCAKPLHQR